MSAAIDLTGRPFGHLLVVARATSDSRGKARWKCLCSCGREKIIVGSSLRRGSTASCGCLGRHGHWRNGRPSPTYVSWVAIGQRCTNPSADSFALYGGCGIRVCERWSAPGGFAAFLADMGERPDGTTLDRIDNAKGYEPGNCRWADAEEQQNNRGSFNRRLMVGGETLTVAQWERKMGLPEDTIRRRLKRGWSAEQSVICPLLPRGGPKPAHSIGPEKPQRARSA